MTYKGKLQFTIGERDVGNIVVKRTCECNCPKCNGKLTWYSPLGRVHKRDIGKQVYLVKDILYVENEEQRDKREEERDIRAGLKKPLATTT